MQKKYESDAAIYVVYIREAHPTDGRQSRANVQAEVLFKQPKTAEQRNEIAHQMCTKLELSLPCLVDGIDNKVGTAYSGMPDRLYVVGIDGKIVYKGARGPRGFKPAEAEEALDKHLADLKAKAEAAKKE